MLTEHSVFNIIILEECKQCKKSLERSRIQDLIKKFYNRFIRAAATKDTVETNNQVIAADQQTSYSKNLGKFL